MSNNSSSSSGGVGFVGVLTIVFIVLKILGHITWSWWWVLSPIWISVVLVIGIIALIFGFIFIKEAITGFVAERRRTKKIQRELEEDLL